MNAPDLFGLTSILGSLSMSYSPLVDRERRTFGTRLTMLAVKPSDRLPVGSILDQLNGLWPESRALVLMAPLDAQLDDSLLEWQPPMNAVVEIPAIALRDPTTQGLVQRAHRAGIKMALRGRPDVPLPLIGALGTGAAILGVLAAAVTTRLALRASPAEAMRAKQ